MTNKYEVWKFRQFDPVIVCHENVPQAMGKRRAENDATRMPHGAQRHHICGVNATSAIVVFSCRR